MVKWCWYRSHLGKPCLQVYSLVLESASGWVVATIYMIYSWLVPAWWFRPSRWKLWNEMLWQMEWNRFHFLPASDFIYCQPVTSFIASQWFHLLPASDFIYCQPVISLLPASDFIIASQRFHYCHGLFHSLPASYFTIAMVYFIPCQPAISFLASQQFHLLPASNFTIAMGDFIPCQPVISFLFISCQTFLSHPKLSCYQRSYLQTQSNIFSWSRFL